MTKIGNDTGEPMATMCDWCMEIIETVGVPWYEKTEFTLEFAEGVNAGLGPLEMGGWQVEDLCLNCAAKLNKALNELGLTVTPLYYTALINP